MLSDSFRQQKSTGLTSADSYLMQVTESAEVCRMNKILSQSRTIFLMYCISTILMCCTYKQTPLVQIQPIHYLKEFGCSLLWRSWWSSGLISPWIQLDISSLHWLLVYNMHVYYNNSKLLQRFKIYLYKSFINLNQWMQKNSVNLPSVGIPRLNHYRMRYVRILCK